jgi:putative transcription factor
MSPDLYCDICGRQPVRGQILLEGAKLLVCGSCMRSGKILHRFEDDEIGSEPSEPIQVRNTPSFDRGEEIIEDAAKLIRSTREKMKLPLQVMAERLNEKESYLQGVEGGRVQPSLELARKLEKELNIKLIEKTREEVTTSVSVKKFTPPTLGDMIEITPEKKKKK